MAGHGLPLECGSSSSSWERWSFDVADGRCQLYRSRLRLNLRLRAQQREGRLVAKFECLSNAVMMNGGRRFLDD